MEAIACISIRQPWAWAILHGGKRIENRVSPDPWRSRVGQRIYIHAAKGCTRDEYDDAASFIEDAIDLAAGTSLGRRPPPLAELPRGALVGTAKLVAVKHYLDPTVAADEWTIGDWCLVLDEVRPLSAALPWKGALGWFPGPPDAEAAIAAWAATEDADGC